MTFKIKGWCSRKIVGQIIEYRKGWGEHLTLQESLIASKLTMAEGRYAEYYRKELKACRVGRDENNKKLKGLLREVATYDRPKVENQHTVRLRDRPDSVFASGD
jgi:hypothetical protein